MKTNWQTKKLGQICKIGDGNHSSKYPKKNEMVNSGVPFIRANNLIDGNVSWNDMKFISKDKHEILKKGHLKTGDVLFTNRGEIGKIAIVGADFNNSNLNSQIAWFRCTEELSNKFLSYFLSSPKLQDHYLVEKNGAALQQFTIRQINDISVPTPPILDQKRIVKILDEVFESIVKAKENTEKNMQNSKELFESYLQSVFANNPKWEVIDFEKSIDKVIYTNKIKRNKFLKAGNFPVVSQEKDLINGYWDNKEDTFRIKVPVVIFGDHTQILKYINFDFVLGADGVKILQPQKFLESKFFYYLLTSVKLKNLGYARHYKILKERKISFPKSLFEQKSIVKKLDDLSAETKKLEAIYKQKLADLEELKKSVLKKAFNGEL